MKTKIFFGFLICLMIISFIKTDSILAQVNHTGSLSGIVTGSNTKAPLPFANVIIVGTNNGVATNMNGKYLIRDIAVGEQKVKISYVGYVSKVISVVIRSGKTTLLNVVLKIGAVKGKEVVVTSQRIGQQEAINEQVNSNTIVNVVAPDRLQENPDANAAEALGRLPGLSLIRSGGEGKSIVIRGMMPDYSTVTINGVELPSTDNTGRSTSLSGISQFLLQKVAVYKAITPDMDGNSVAGSIDLTLSPAPENFHYNLIAQGGFNHQNNYWGNYKFVGNVSDRLFNKKLGVKFNIDFERVNRSTQTMGASYAVTSNITSGIGNEKVELSTVNLNAVTNIPSTVSGTLVLDYSFSPSTKVFFYNLFSRRLNNNTLVTRSFGGKGGDFGDLIVNQHSGTNLMYTSSIRAEHSLSWVDIDFGAGFSVVHNYAPQDKSWNFLPWDFRGDIHNHEDLTPQEYLSSISQNYTSDTLASHSIFYIIGYSSNDQFQENITPYFNAKIPFSFGNSVSGYIKGGFKYYYIHRKRNYLSGINNIISSPGAVAESVSGLDWTEVGPIGLYGTGLANNEIEDFLGGQYSFGWYPNLDRLNELWNAWNNFSNAALAEGRDAVVRKYGFVAAVGFVPDIAGSSLNNQDLKEKYVGTYLMSEIDLGNLLMFLPGVRYEKVTDNLTGHKVSATVSPYGMSIPGTLENAVHNDEFILPMIHLQIKPEDWLRIHLSYTQSVRRPDFNALSPNIYVNNTFGSYRYDVGNPYLKPELWKNFDLQIAVFGNEIGLFSVDGYYKKVSNKIWERSYTRLPGDPVVPGFPEDQEVTVTEWLNHQDPGYVKGVEFEWQTSFWYLPSPLNHLSLYTNFTLLKSEQQYPITRLWTTYEYDNMGRPHPTLHRVDSAKTDQMLNQPNSIVNISLGFNYKGFDAWLSFQYNGKTLTGWTSQRELIPYTGSFYKWDFQAVQKLPFKGMELLFNVANISNFQQVKTMMGDPRPTYLESYGWTSDLGFRYKF